MQCELNSTEGRPTYNLTLVELSSSPPLQSLHQRHQVLQSGTPSCQHSCLAAGAFALQHGSVTCGLRHAVGTAVAAAACFAGRIQPGCSSTTTNYANNMCQGVCYGVHSPNSVFACSFYSSTRTEPSGTPNACSITVRRYQRAQ